MPQKHSSPHRASRLLPWPCLLASVLLCLPTAKLAGQAGPAALSTQPSIAISPSLTIQQPAKPSKPFTVTGARGAILGMQNGEVELWQLPVKVFSGLHLTAELDGYPVVIDLNSNAAELEVHPGHSILTYAHAAIRVRQHMLVPPATPEGAQPGAGRDAGALMYFEIDSVKPATVTISLRPAMSQEWPAPQYGVPGASWIPMGTGGAYSLATDNPSVFGMVAMPGSTPGYLPPYQEHPQTLPLQFRVRYDPAGDRDRIFPLVSTVAQPGETNSAEANSAMAKRLVNQAAALPAISQAINTYYADFLKTRLAVHTPDARFDEAMRWAEIAIEEAQVETRSGTGAQAKSETGLVAGWFPSFDSARPGFGWYFGRDTLWSLYAIDSYGDRTLAKRALEFLRRRQRADGKMMHEYSLSADFLTGATAWSNFGYEYAAADSTPLFLLAMEDYVRTTGETEFLRTHWDQLKLAYRFESTTDSDGDGVYDNAQGTGWVEQWGDPHPHQELYLAALDRAASAAMGRLAALMGDSALASSAGERARKIAGVVERYRQPDGLYAFNQRADKSFETTKTIYPSVALWSREQGLAHPEAMLSLWSSAAMDTDWGTRSVPTDDPVFDPISYHQGSVWPLFTGWSSMAAYRNGRPMAGYAALRQNVELTRAEDPGAITEVLSGAFYQALGRSSTHQLWSSAMTIAPAIRGLFGVDVDASHRTIAVQPHLPVQWNEAELENVRVGTTMYHLRFRRQGSRMVVTATSAVPTVLCLDPEIADSPCTAAPKAEHSVNVPLPAVEAGLHDPRTPLPGDGTTLPHVVDERYTAGQTLLTMEAQAGSEVLLDVRRNGLMDIKPWKVHMPEGTGYVRTEVKLAAASPRN